MSPPHRRTRPMVACLAGEALPRREGDSSRVGKWRSRQQRQRPQESLAGKPSCPPRCPPGCLVVGKPSRPPGCLAGKPLCWGRKPGSHRAGEVHRGGVEDGNLEAAALGRARSPTGWRNQSRCGRETTKGKIWVVQSREATGIEGGRRGEIGGQQI